MNLLANERLFLFTGTMFGMRAVNSSLWMRCKSEGKVCSLVSCPSKHGLDEQHCLTSTYVLEVINSAVNSSHVITEKDLVILRPSMDNSSFIRCKGKSVCKYSSTECGMPGPFDAEACKRNIMMLQLHTAKGSSNSSYPLVTLNFLHDEKTVWLGCNRENKKKCKRFFCSNGQHCTPDSFELVKVL